MNLVDMLPDNALTAVGALLLVAIVGGALWALITPTKRDDEALLRLLDHLARLRDDIAELRRRFLSRDQF